MARVIATLPGVISVRKMYRFYDNGTYEVLTGDKVIETKLWQILDGKLQGKLRDETEWIDWVNPEEWARRVEAELAIEKMLNE